MQDTIHTMQYTINTIQDNTMQDTINTRQDNTIQDKTKKKQDNIDTIQRNATLLYWYAFNWYSLLLLVGWYLVYSTHIPEQTQNAGLSFTCSPLIVDPNVSPRLPFAPAALLLLTLPWIESPASAPLSPELSLFASYISAWSCSSALTSLSTHLRWRFQDKMARGTGGGDFSASRHELTWNKTFHALDHAICYNAIRSTIQRNIMLPDESINMLEEQKHAQECHCPCSMLEETHINSSIILIWYFLLVFTCYYIVTQHSAKIQQCQFLPVSLLIQ